MHKQREWEDKYGKVRPVIHVDWRGKRWIAVGDRLLSSSQWKTFVDFLGDYIKFVFAPEWGRQELAKPLQQRHVIMQWYDGVCGFQKEHIGTAGEVVQLVPNGVMAAYFSLAYDLYLLNHHQCLQTSLVRRLKHSDQFQGARYELFAAATALRAGFELHFEDESDGSSKHPEFIAVHPPTGQRFAIEAKSRHRDGVLGRPGTSPDADPRAGVERLLNKAAAKLDAIPFILFLDVNVPPSDQPVFEIPWVREVLDALVDRAERCHGGKDPFNMVVVTNHPHHYGAAEQPDPRKHLLAMFARDPLIPVSHSGALQELYTAAEKYGRIPQRFEDMS